MCNLYNTANAYVGSRTNYNGCYASNQRMCRDVNGNIWVRMTSDNCYCSSCCHCCNHTCCNSCGCNGSNGGGTSQNDATNGSYGCITLCGVSVNTSAQNANASTTTSRCWQNRYGGCSRCGYSSY